MDIDQLIKALEALKSVGLSVPLNGNLTIDVNGGMVKNNLKVIENEGILKTMLLLLS